MNPLNLKGKLVTCQTSNVSNMWKYLNQKMTQWPIALSHIEGSNTLRNVTCFLDFHFDRLIHIMMIDAWLHSWVQKINKTIENTRFTGLQSRWHKWPKMSWHICFLHVRHPTSVDWKCGFGYNTPIPTLPSPVSLTFNHGLTLSKNCTVPCWNIWKKIQTNIILTTLKKIIF